MAVVHSISVATYSSHGARLVLKYPDFSLLPECPDELLASQCMTSSGQQVKEEEIDFSYLVQRVPAESAVAGRSMGGSELLFGCAAFDPKKQRAVLALFYKPYFGFFRRRIAETLAALNLADVDHGQERVLDKLRSLYDSIATAPREELPQGEIEGISLTDLVVKFKTSTMHLWYAIMEQKRVVFLSNTAKESGNCCLAATLLAGPMGPYLVPICEPSLVRCPLLLLGLITCADMGAGALGC